MKFVELGIKDKYIYSVIALFLLFLAQSEAIKNITIILMLLYFLQSIATKRITISKDLVNYSIIAHVVVLGLGIFFGINAQESLNQYTDILKILLVFLFFREVDLSFISFESIVNLLFIGFLLALGLSIIDYYILNYPFLELHSVGSVNRSAVYIMYIFIISLSVQDFLTSKSSQFFVLITILLSGLAIILGGSRMAMFSLPVILFMYFYLNNKLSFKNLAIGLLPIVALLLAAFYFFPDSRVVSRFDQGFSDVARIQIWVSSIYTFFANNALFGIGVGNSIFVDVASFFGNPVTGKIDNTHQLYLDMLMERGLLGFVTFMTFISSLFFYSSNSCANINIVRLLVLGMLLMGFANITFRYEFALLFVAIVGSYLNPNIEKYFESNTLH